LAAGTGLIIKKIYEFRTDFTITLFTNYYHMRLDHWTKRAGDGSDTWKSDQMTDSWITDYSYTTSSCQDVTLSRPQRSFK